MIQKIPKEIIREILSFLLFDKKKYKYYCIKCNNKFESNENYIEYYLNNQNSCPCYINWIKNIQ